MPRLKPSEIPGFVAEYESPFPAAEMTDGVTGSAWRDIADVTAPARVWRCTHRLTALSVGRLATIHGVPKFELKAIQTLGELGQLPLGNDFVKLAKAGGSLVGDLLKYSEAVDKVASAIPVLGTYARLIVGFVTFLKNAFSRAAQARLSVPKTASDALGYNRQIDQDVANYCAEQLAEKDWTRIFLPARKPGDSFSLHRTSFIGDGTPDGYSIVPTGGVKHAHGLGFVPGVAGRFVQWQYPIKVFGSNRPASPWDSLISIADLEPSVTQLTVGAWQMVLKNGPNMFRIAPYQIKSAWRDFFGAMHDWSRWLKKTDQDRGAEMADAIATWVGKEYPGATTGYRVRNPWTKYKKKALDSGEVPSVNADALVDFIVDRQHGDSLDAALATITVAYVGPQFALIRENDTVREKWDARRRQLLGHRAKWDVELDLVPDQEFRSALNDARRGPKPADLKSVPKGFGGVPRFADPGKPPPPASAIEPSMPNSAGGGSGKPSPKGKGGGGAAVALAAAAAAFFVLR